MMKLVLAGLAWAVCVATSTTTIAAEQADASIAAPAASKERQKVTARSKPPASVRVEIISVPLPVASQTSGGADKPPLKFNPKKE